MLKRRTTSRTPRCSFPHYVHPHLRHLIAVPELSVPLFDVLAVFQCGCPYSSPVCYSSRANNNIMKNSTRLSAVLAISIAFFCAEIAIGFRTKSLVRELFRLPSPVNPEPPAKALIADAFHYLNVSRKCIFGRSTLTACNYRT